MAVPPPRKAVEIKAIAIAAAVAAVFLALYLIYDGGFRTAPTVSEGGESPVTAAPSDVEPTEPAIEPAELKQ